MANATGDLLDINVWLALTVADHEHHVYAQQYWRDAAHAKLWFCRHTTIGLMRLLCQPRIMGPRVLGPVQALEAYRQTRRFEGVGLMADPAGLEDALARWAETAPWSVRMWPDAYLCAFASAANLRLISFDRDFARFPGLNWLHVPTEGHP